MKTVVTFFAICLTLSAKGQFAVITDRDGFVNVRRENSIGNNITDTLRNGHLIYCIETTGNWTNINFRKSIRESTGFIYKDRYKLVSSFEKIPIHEQGKTTTKLSKDSIEIIVTQTKFDKTKHKFKFVNNENEWIELIDNKEYWGTDGEIPEFEYQSISIKIGQKKITLPKKATENLFQPNLKNTKANFDKLTNTLYIHSMNSDGAGGYEVIWKIVNGIYKERFLAYGF
jgi:hypothetical protein